MNNERVNPIFQPLLNSLNPQPMNPNKPDADKAAEEYAEQMMGLGKYSDKWDYADKVMYNTLAKAVRYGTKLSSSQSGKERAALEKIANLPDAISESAAFDVARNIARQALYGN